MSHLTFNKGLGGILLAALMALGSSCSKKDDGGGSAATPQPVQPPVSAQAAQTDIWRLIRVSNGAFNSVANGAGDIRVEAVSGSLPEHWQSFLTFENNRYVLYRWQLSVMGEEFIETSGEFRVENNRFTMKWRNARIQDQQDAWDSQTPVRSEEKYFEIVRKDAQSLIFKDAAQNQYEWQRVALDAREAFSKEYDPRRFDTAVRMGAPQVVTDIVGYWRLERFHGVYAGPRGVSLPGWTYDRYYQISKHAVIEFDNTQTKADNGNYLTDSLYANSDELRQSGSKYDRDNRNRSNASVRVFRIEGNGYNFGLRRLITNEVTSWSWAPVGPGVISLPQQLMELGRVSPSQFKRWKTQNDIE